MWQSLATIATLAIHGPKYKTNVWRPVPNPIDEAIPKTIQYIMKYPISFILLTYGVWGPYTTFGTIIIIVKSKTIYQYLSKTFSPKIIFSLRIIPK